MVHRKQSTTKFYGRTDNRRHRDRNTPSAEWAGGKKGGGVGILHRTNCNVKPQKTTTFKSFEYMEVILSDASMCVRLITLYRLPPSKDNKLTDNMFFSDFQQYLEHIAVSSGCLVLLGDFNIHFDDLTDNQTRKFLDILNLHSLTQHVTGRTHKNGHALDLILTRDLEDIVCTIDVAEPCVISDHSAIDFNLS